MRFSAPGTPPFYQPPTLSGIVRYEEDHPVWRYNGAQLETAPTTWSESQRSNSSKGWDMASRTTGNWASMAFTGTWASLGLLGQTNLGQAEVFIDGVSQGIVDTYRRSVTQFSMVFAGLANTAHTLSVTVRGTRNAFSSDNWMRGHYLDVWDGTTMPDGAFEETDARVQRSADWDAITQAPSPAAATSTAMAATSGSPSPAIGLVAGYADTWPGQVET